MTRVVYGNGVVVNLTTPFLNGDDIVFAGTGTGSSVIIDDGAVNTWDTLAVTGRSAHAEAHGSVQFNYPNSGSLVLTHGISLSYGNLFLSSQAGGSYTLNGNSVVTNNSTLNTYGGRYQAVPVVLNGNMVVSKGSTADLSHTPLQGNGSIFVSTGATVDLDRVVAGINVYMGDGTVVYSNLPYHRMQFLGAVHEGPFGTTDVLNASNAVEEIFNRSTGVLDLLSGYGTTVAELRFAGGYDLYTTPDGRGNMDITTAHHQGSLPTIFTH
jgi:hypothetical protein